ncbi:MAG TPA: HNH endonuclease signature motif containing protein [Kofleriaceae bacterium]|nr:HNH endonuclease signature motif containing protein [Kofleriaceae bacterium]
MPTYTLTHVADEKLLADLAALVSADRQTTALLIAHIAEVDARELFKPAACSSMHAYCRRVLRLSADAAFTRIRAARAGREFPQIFDAIADGRLHLSGVVLLAPHLRGDNVDRLIDEATHKSKLEIEMLVARVAPRPDVPTTITAIVPPAEPPSSLELAPGPVANPAATPFTLVKPLAPERYALQTTIGQATRDKLERAKALMSHRNPSGDLAVVLDAALDALIERLEKQKFAKTTQPRAARPREAGADPTYIPAEVRRAVYERDAGQCTFTSDDGMRCDERRFLELDHITMVCRGGQPTVDGLRLRCKPHNQHAAEEALGVNVMRAKREAAARDRDVTRALRDMGFKADETDRAMSNTADVPASTPEERLRVALAELTRMRGNRCSDGAFDASMFTAPGTGTTELAPPSYARP